MKGRQIVLCRAKMGASAAGQKESVCSQASLAIIDLSFSFKMQVNVLQVIAIGAALFIYRKVR